MTVRLLAALGQYPANAIVTFSAAVETALVGDSLASTDLSGGIDFQAPMTPARVSAADRGVIASVGDSITRRNYDDVSYAYPRVTNQGALYWALALSGARLRAGRSKGISGAASSAIISTALPVVLDPANNPKLNQVVIHMGANDLAGLRTPSAAVAAVDALITNYYDAARQVLARGALPVIAAVMRRTDVGAVPKQSLFDAAWTSANGALRQLSSQNGWPFWDMNRYWVDATDALISGLSIDQVHPNVAGGHALGRPGSALLAAIAPPVDWANHGYLSEVTGNPSLSVGTGGTLLSGSSGVTVTGGAAAVIPEGFSLGDLGAANGAVATVSRDGDGLLSISLTTGGIVLEKSFSAQAGQVYEAVSAFEISGGNNNLFSVTTDLINSVQQQIAATGAQDNTTSVFYPGTAICKDATHQVVIPANGTYRARVLVRSAGGGSAAVVKISSLALYRVR